jgi:ribose transport system permease protein
MSESRTWNQALIVLQRLGSVIGLLLLVIVLSILSRDFLTTGNLLTVLRQVSINALIAFGMTFVILAGGIDLSVGAVLAFSGAITAGVMAAGFGMVVAIVAGLGVGALLGVVNGVLVSWGRVAPFIATLGMMTLVRGLTLSYTQGEPISVSNQGFAILGGGYIAHLIPIPVVWMFVVFALCGFVLRGTVFGRHVFAVGVCIRPRPMRAAATSWMPSPPWCWAARAWPADVAGCLAPWSACC